MTGALPTFFVIGAPKAGTTSLHQYLSRHRQVQMSRIKEPRFFARLASGPEPQDRIADLARYERLFDATFEVRGESSTDYSAYPRWQGAPEAIRELVPKAKFIYVVRDPVARTLSHYRMRVSLTRETRPLAEALADMSDLHSPYISPSLYATQLERYLRLFSQQRVLVIDQADLLTARHRTLEEIFYFLSVAPPADFSQFDEELLSNSEWRAYPSLYARLIASLSPRVQWAPSRLRRTVRRTIEARLWSPLGSAAVDDGLRARLVERFGPEVSRLRALTGKAFSSWSV